MDILVLPLFFSFTEPSTPRSVNISSETTDTISITVTRGDGIVKRYTILKDGTFYKTVNVTNNSLKTNTVINRLQPGTAYDSFSVVAVSNDLNSTEIVISPHATCKYKTLDDITFKFEC